MHNPILVYAPSSVLVGQRFPLNGGDRVRQFVQVMLEREMTRCLRGRATPRRAAGERHFGGNGGRHRSPRAQHGHRSRSLLEGSGGWKSR